MLVYLSDWSAQTMLRAATLRYKLHIKLSTSPSHSILTPGRPVPALTLQCQMPGRVAAGVPIFKSLVWLDPEKSHRKRDLNPGSSAPEADALTTRPVRPFFEQTCPSNALCLLLGCEATHKQSVLVHVCEMSSVPCLSDRMLGLMVKVSASRVEDRGFEFHLCQDFPGWVIPVTLKLALQWLPCH